MSCCNCNGDIRPHSSDVHLTSSTYVHICSLRGMAMREILWMMRGFTSWTCTTEAFIHMMDLPNVSLTFIFSVRACNLMTGLKIVGGRGGGHGGRVITLLPPTSEAGVRFLARPRVGKLVVACPWSAVYSTEP